jgi:hypothetical protein
MPEIHDDAPVIIYKTTSDYTLNIPITMNEAKDRILSYPDPSDVLHKGELMVPVKLKRGFLLDRRGVNPNTVFTSFTYEDYSRLDNPPSLEQLQKSIIDKNPFEAIYRCGDRSEFTDLVRELRKGISRGFEGYTSLLAL